MRSSLATRRSDLIQFEGSKVHRVDPTAEANARHRTFSEADFCTIPGASTACKFKIVVNHTRSGQGSMRISGRTPQKRLDFKKHVATRCLQIALDGDQRIGLCMGDFNIEAKDLQDVLWGFPNPPGRALRALSFAAAAGTLGNVHSDYIYGDMDFSSLEGPDVVGLDKVHQAVYAKGSRVEEAGASSPRAVDSPPLSLVSSARAGATEVVEVHLEEADLVEARAVLEDTAAVRADWEEFREWDARTAEPAPLAATVAEQDAAKREKFERINADLAVLLESKTHMEKKMEREREAALMAETSAASASASTPAPPPAAEPAEPAAEPSAATGGKEEELAEADLEEVEDAISAKMEEGEMAVAEDVADRRRMYAAEAAKAARQEADERAAERMKETMQEGMASSSGQGASASAPGFAALMADEEDADWGRDEEEEEAAPAAPERVAAGPFRRQGLPVRCLVERRGDVFVSLGNDAKMVWEVAQIIIARRMHLEHCRAVTSTPDAPVRSTDALKRSSQGVVWQAVFRTWMANRGHEHGINYRPRDPMPTGRLLRRAQAHFKTHCYQVFGGVHWLKFIVCLGRVPPEAVEATNVVLELRAREVDELRRPGGKYSPLPRREGGSILGTEPRVPDGPRFMTRESRPAAEDMPLPGRHFRRKAQMKRRLLEMERFRLHPNQIMEREVEIDDLLKKSDNVSKAGRQFLRLLPPVLRRLATCSHSCVSHHQGTCARYEQVARAFRTSLLSLLAYDGRSTLLTCRSFGGGRVSDGRGV